MKRLFRTVFVTAALILIVAASVMQVRAGNAGDKNWLLLAAKMWLGGKTLYVDIFELDPPLIVWIYAIPSWLSLHLGLPDFKWLGLMGLLACAVSVYLSLRLIRLHPAFTGNTRRQTDFALLLAGMFVFFTTQVYFFDREHIFLVLTFPYVLRFMPSLARQRAGVALRVIIALAAALGFCIKPYTLVVFILFQLLYILRERRLAILFSLENLIIYAGGISYLLCVWLFAPAYILDVMPMAWFTYSGFNRRVNGYLFLSIAAISAGLTFVELRVRDSSPFRRDAYYFIGVCGAQLAYALANNGWGYTYNPLLCMLLFMSGWMLWDYGWLKRDAIAQGIDGKRFGFAVQGCVLNLVLNSAYMIVCLFVFFTTASCGQYAECSQNDVFAAYIKEHRVRSFGELSMNLRKWTSLVRHTGAVLDTRFNHLWMLPKLMQEGEAFTARHPFILNYLGRGFAEDLNNRKPDIVFVEAGNAIFGYPHPVDIVAYLSSVPEFKAAWNSYLYAGTIDQCEGHIPSASPAAPRPQIECRFTIYQRLPQK